MILLKLNYMVETKPKNNKTFDAHNQIIIKKISLPTTKCFMIPDFLRKNPYVKAHCSKCINRFKEFGNDFIKMAKNNLVSELPFSAAIQKIILQCTKCNS